MVGRMMSMPYLCPGTCGYVPLHGDITDVIKDIDLNIGRLSKVTLVDQI